MEGWRPLEHERVDRGGQDTGSVVTTPLTHLAVVQFPTSQLSPFFLGGDSSVQSKRVVAEVAVDVCGVVVETVPLVVGTVVETGVEQFWETTSTIQLALQCAI